MAGKEKPTPEAATHEGERIAKVLSRRGVASRREAERLIEAGEVTVNGKIITSAALNVTDADKITISGHPLPVLEPARLWLYYKPDGLVTSASDEKGRDTVFDHLPEDLPRVMSVGRLDLNSEGLLLLTNDGELKRRLELPSTGWLRKYRVRVNGNPTDPDLEPLRKGITVEGEKFQPMNVVLDRHQGANAWLTVGLREGKNREIRRAMSAINLTVNRLIRVSYGPFRLGELKPGEVEEVRAKVLREQLGEGGGQDAPDPAARKPRTAATRTATRRVRPGDAIKALAKAWDEATAEKTPAGPKPARQDDDRPARSPRSASARPERSDDTRAPRGAAAPRPSAPKYGSKPARQDDDRPARSPRSASARPERSDDTRAPRGAAAPRPSAPKSGAKPARRDDGPAPRPASGKPRGAASGSAAAKPARPSADKPRSGSGIAGPRGGKPPSRPRKG